MPRINIIVLDTPDLTTTRANFRLALWADVPASRQKFYANPSAKSAWVDATSTDNTNLQNGSMVETVVTYLPSGPETVGQMEADVQQLWTAWQNSITNNNHWPNYGSTWVSTATPSWTITTVA